MTAALRPLFLCLPVAALVACASTKDVDARDERSVGPPAVADAVGPAGAPAPSAVAFDTDKPGFVIRVDGDGRPWVFAAGSEDLAAFDRGEEAAKTSTLFIGGVAYRSVELTTLQNFQAALPGFALRQGGDGNTWVFRADSEALAAFDRGEEPGATATIFVGGKPYHSVDIEVLRAYEAARN